MLFCPKCNHLMRHVYRFTPEKNVELDICNSCYFETKPKLLKTDTLKVLQNNTRNNNKVNRVKPVKQKKNISKWHKNKKGKKR